LAFVVVQGSSNGMLKTKGHGVWVPAFAGTTLDISLYERKSDLLHSAACCATVGTVPATVARRMSRGWDWS
jgi:hypothetical protein